ncbi:enoyl-CoA hydratase/isomerase family protein [Caulobacter sp. LARHSG274]
MISSPPTLSAARETAVGVDYLGDIAVVTLARPTARLADLAAGLLEAAHRLAGENRALALILTGAGSVFCAPEPSAADVLAMPALREALLAFQSLNVPVVAAVNGAAVGPGLGLVLACDIAFARPHATLKPSGPVHLGALWFLSRKLGRSRATDLVLAGRTITGGEARELKLVQDCIDKRDPAFLEEVVRRTGGLLSGSRASRAAALRLLRHAALQGLAEHLDVEAAAASEAGPEMQVIAGEKILR